MTIEELQNKTVAVLGVGTEGKAVISYLVQHGIKPVLFDDKTVAKPDLNEDDQNWLSSVGVESHFGPGVFSALTNFQVIFRSPGVPYLSPYLKSARDAGAVVTSQAKWFFNHCPAPIIGVTGTKGKGTTSSLICEIINSDGQKKVFLTGNIGKTQPLEILDFLQPDNLVVYELSSFQLQDLEQSPHIGVVLMVTEDHLDHHQTVGEYRTAKGSIVKYQSEGDFAIINYDNSISMQIGSLSKGTKIYFSRKTELESGAFVKDKTLIVKNINSTNYSFDLSSVQLRGEHNYENFAAAVLASLMVGASDTAIQQSLNNFRGLEHRLEFIVEHDKIKFYNDSFSTVPETAVAAARAFSEPLIMILGGSDKHLSYEQMGKDLAMLPNLQTVALLGVVAPQIKNALETAGYKGKFIEAGPVFENTLKEIKKVAPPGSAVVLSPAAASFDMFKNYIDRGEQFRQLVSRWSEL